jgi:LysR family transcriptional activator of nhaA
MSDRLKINLHHLQYFWAVASDGNLTRTANRMRVAQSALSAQIRQLEGQIGHKLFLREGRKLVLTEAGRIALAYAEDIFTTGRELLSTLEDGRRPETLLRIGVVATLSRNFQESFIRPILGEPNARLRLESGSLADLLNRLSTHALDLVLANRPQRDGGGLWRCRRIAKQPVSLVGRKQRKTFRFPEDLGSMRLILPGADSDIRNEFDVLCEQLGIVPRILAEVDDMATMRLLVRDSDGVALLPPVVVRDELKAATLKEYCAVPGIYESFYAIVVQRQYQHPLLRTLLGRSEHDLLGAGSKR